ncbi:MAG TPA: nucleotidyltransferase [Candidatus Macondimonas sp.]|nr:nucleotidyltransferase [Candidatus Macondimonas sp.]
MATNDRKIAQTHDDVLDEIADALDIPPSKFEEAKRRYEAIGDWLDRDESSLAAYDPAISPQGSFLLGTVTRPLTETEEYDVDLVCLLKASKTEFTQKSLKEAVGHEVGLYARAQNMKNPPEEGRRCWTLHYADGAQFHMDILPALPDASRYQVVLKAHGYGTLASDPALTSQAIAITDRTLPQYTQVTDDWPQSNPMGYAAWFRGRMTVQLTERKMAFAKRERIKASVDEIPDYKVKTPLQRAIQLLKRHRDCMFADDGEHKPISIIITTLAAHAYNEEATISETLQSILTGMAAFIEYRGGEAWVANPVNPAENFADKWAEAPVKRESFQRWLEQARRDFALYLRVSRFDAMPDELKEHLGADLVERTLAAVIPPAVAGPAGPAIVKGAATDDSDGRVAAAISDIQRRGSQSKPWAKS